MHQQTPLDELKRFIKTKSALQQLIVINISVFLVIAIIKLFLFLLKIGDIDVIIYLFAVPSDLLTLLSRPWTIFTYMFLHEDFWHIVMNMIMLYFGGRLFLEYFNEKQLVNTYILGGLFGAILYILFYNVFPAFSYSVEDSIALGASASVLAIIIAIASYVPNYTVQLVLFGKVKLKHIAIVLVVIDILSIPQGNSGGHIAHLGGALWGYLFISQYKKGHDLSSILNGFSAILNWFKQPSNKKMKVKHKKKPVSDEDYNMQKAKNQKDIDKILDKISISGYDSLNKDEKEKLFKMSNKS